MRRMPGSRIGGLLVVVAAAASLGAGLPAQPSVLVLGDSYASGEGLPTAEGACGTEAQAGWGPLVAEELAADLQLLACSGAEVADVTVGGALGRPAQLAAAQPADVVLLTIGGNDLGFTEIVADCLGLAQLQERPPAGGAQGPSWSELVTSGAADRGCDVTEEELLDRVDAFAAPERFVVGAEGARGPLAAVYEQVVTRAVADGGRLVVVGYPELFAEVARWPERYGQRCHGLRDVDARALAGIVVGLDAQLAAAVGAANARLGADVVQHVSLLEAFDGTDDGEDHRLCGGGEPWINGLTVAEGGIDVAQLLTRLDPGPGGLDLEELGARPAGSFHPGTAGHRGIAATVLAALEG